jgi:hypothetical protein
MRDWSVPLVAGGMRIEDAGELVRRHLGLSSPPETWAAPLFDERPPTNRMSVETTDLLAAAALGVRITKSSLEGFAAAKPTLDAVVRRLPTDVGLDQADDALLAEVSEALTGTALEPTLTAKLLHRVRPRLVPPYDRAIADCYARAAGDRDAGRPPGLLARMRADLREPLNAVGLQTLQELIAVEGDGGLVPTRLRLFDIAIWMSANA